MSGEMQELGTIRSYEDLVGVLRARCDELDISFRTLDEVAGLADGYAAKLLAPGSMLTMGRGSMAAVLGALGIALVAVEDPAALERVRSRLQKRRRNGPHRQPAGRVEAR
jgi:hypothetical protein